MGRRIWLLGCALALAAAAPALAASYLKLDRIAGPSADAAHKGWLDVESFELDQGRGGERDRTGAGASRGAVASIVVRRRPDSASPELQRAAADGQRFAGAELEVTNSAGAPEVAYRLKNAVISGYRLSGSGQPPEEIVTLGFEAMDVLRTTRVGGRALAPRRLLAP